MEVLQTRQNKPPRILIHGDHGTGKSALGAAFPNPIFINVEDGLDEIETNAFPVPETFDEIMAQLKWVYKEKHDFKTLIIDSIDWCETKVFASVVAEAAIDNDTIKSIADIPYGQGYQSALVKFNTLVNGLRIIRNEKNMAIVLLSHSVINTFHNPLGEDYDVFKIKLREKNAELFQEFVTMIGFLHFKTHVKKTKEGFKESKKVIGGTQRVLSVSPNAAYTSKNRYGITTDILLPSPAEGYQNLITAITGEAK